MDALCDDLVALILRNNVGVWTFVQASAVCKQFHRVCRSDESLLVSAALYTGGLTKAHFAGLFALSPVECKRFTHKVIHRTFGGVYCLFGTTAIEHVMRAVGGIEGWRARVAARVPVMRPQRRPSFGKRPQWELEEGLHRRHVRARLPIATNTT